MGTNAFSVAMCVYGKDNPVWFDKSLESISIQQSLKPSEIILVIDGPISKELEEVVEKYKRILEDNKIVFGIIRFENNQGHGNARRASVDNASNKYIALMDADDISFPNRFEKQIKLLDGGIDICGGDISEFIDEETNIVSYRKLPQTDSDIKKYAKSRCPMNQMTVMFKKDIYDKAGGYIDWYQDEDYYLWVRMIEKGFIFANTGTSLVKVRIGDDMFKRRGGLKYYKSEKKLQKYMLKTHFISFPKYVSNCLKRFIVQVLMPNKMRAWAFKKYARSN